MPFVHLLIEGLFYYAGRWLGCMIVKVITLGKVDLDWPGRSESIVAEVVGLTSLFVIGFAIILTA